MSNSAAETDDFLGMSDEDFANVNTAELDDSIEAEEPVAELEESAEVEEAEASVDEGYDKDTTEDTSEDTSEETAEDLETTSKDELDEQVQDEKSEKEEVQETETAVNHEDFYKQITAGFKANGKTMNVDNAEDVIRLMQMGADYNRKMSAMKPNMRMLKMLEKNELLSEEKLSYLIDLEKGTPEAITKLLKDKEVDPSDLDLHEDNEYRASDHSVDEREIALDEVLDRIKSSPTYSKTINVMTKEWDDASRQIVANEPQLLELIDSHMANGVYDLISTEIEKERTFGRLTGMSDMDAYRTVGDHINSQGGFNHLYPSQEQEAVDIPAVKEKIASKKADESKRRDKRKAASPTKPTASAPKTDKDFNPLSMSDDAFMKQINEKFL